MYRALAWKELRETWWMSAAACLVVAIGICNEVGLIDLERSEIYWMRDVFTRHRQQLPFSDDEFTLLVVAAAAVLGAILGFWQTLFESVSGTWPFLMHRPLTRRGMLFTKLGTGAALICVATGLPVLLYALWLATIGARAQPFRWWMTTETWVLWFAAFGIYLAAFLCGLRDARWHVSRLWPLVPAVLLPVCLGELARLSGLGLWFAAAVLLDVALLGAIAHAARDRDFA
jgi:hypothetical protein